MPRLALLLLLAASLTRPAAATFTTFESGPVRPLALSPDGTRLFATNTPDDRLEVFAVGAGGLTPAGSVGVGLEPVAVAVRTDSEVWVVNHLSDSVSIVDVGSTPPRVIRTLLVGDEPRDVVFAGPGRTRAFVTTAHRGQNSPVPLADLTTPGIGRADVWVFDATALGTSLGGTPLTILTLFGDTPRALAVTPDGSTVYAAVFQSGNRTTTVNEIAVCDGGMSAKSCPLVSGSAPGGLPPPNTDFQGVYQPETGLIVQFDPVSGQWRDRRRRDWSAAVRLALPDLDVFRIDAAAQPLPVQTASFAGVGTILFDMVVNPASGKVYVSNTDAHNEVRFEGPGFFGGSTVRGHLHEARITVLDGAQVLPRHLNKHIDYAVVPSPVATGAASLAIPTGMAVTADGTTLFVAAFGSSAIGVLDTAALEADTFAPSAASHIPVRGGGPAGLVLDDVSGRLYAFTRFDDGISVIDTTAKTEVAHLRMHDAEPASVVRGRPFLYDATATSSNGEASCASCHVFGDFDGLAWDLGNPDGVVASNPNPMRLPNQGTSFEGFHPLKGPMTTQSLRGMANHGPMHWRGDRTAGSDPGGDPLDERGAFKKFNVAFGGLLGRTGPIDDSAMGAFADFILQVTYPPNPIRKLDGSLTPSQQRGHDFYFNVISDTLFACNGCHQLLPGSGPGAGFFGTDGFTSFEAEPQLFKIAHLRNAYQKVGMFGMACTGALPCDPSAPVTDQVRGFGFLHDGSVDTLFRFHGASVFNVTDQDRRDLEQFVLAFDSNLAPVVGQQITLDDTNAGVVGPRVTLLEARADLGECDLAVQGVVGGLARGAVRLANGTFQMDRQAEAPLDDGSLRALAATPGQPLTFTCVPPGSGSRVGVDRDEDGTFDRDELDAGTDPADPQSYPGAPPTTTTVSSTSTTTSTVTTTTLPYVLIPTRALVLTERLTLSKPAERHVRFRARTKKAARDRIVPPPRDGAGDPTLHGATLAVYNASGLTPEFAPVALPAVLWTRMGSGAQPKGYRYRDPNFTRRAITAVTVSTDAITITGGGVFWPYTLQAPSQGAVAVRLSLGTGVIWCAEAPAKTKPSKKVNDRKGRFVAQPNSQPPLVCPRAQ